MRRPRWKPWALTRLYRRKSYLRRAGWFESYARRAPVDARGRPVPLLTYPALELLARRVPEGVEVFEYGSRSSTLWWAERAKRVVSVEHHAGWAKHVRARAPANVELHLVPLERGGGYSRRVLEEPGAFDVVVIDGRDRARCARNALSALRETGVLVWDDTHRERYAEGIRALLGEGFRRLELPGMNPTSERPKETSIFYCDGNVLGI